MIIKVPFSYQASVIKKGHRKEETLYFWEFADIEIPEVDDMDAPIATRWFDRLPEFLTGFHEKSTWGASPEDGINETRWFDDNHWWPAVQIDRNRHYGEDCSRISVQQLTSMCEQFDSNDNPIMAAFYRRGSSDPVPLIEDDFRQVASETRTTELAALHQRASDLIIVDGGVWRRGLEPVCYLKELYSVGSSHQMVIKIAENGHRTIKDERNTYRADMYDQAVRASVIQDDGDIQDIYSDRRIEVFIPESIRYDGEERAFESAIDSVLSTYGSKQAKFIPSDVLLTYVPLRTAAFEMKQSLTTLDEVSSHFENFLMSIQFDDDTTFKTGMSALDRWKSKPISLDFLEDDVTFSPS